MSINSYLFEDLRPTSMLSFTVRELKCQGGVVIATSNNPKQYNGYKVYLSVVGDSLKDSEEKLINFKSILWIRLIIY